MRTLIVAMITLALGLSGCTNPAEFGSASIYVKDAPTDEFAEIHVVFTKVEVHFAGNGSEDDNGTEEEDEGTWRVLFENSAGTDVDLLAASGDASAFLGEEDLEVGKYTQIRIEVSEAYGIDHDGERVDITVSSGNIHIIKPFDVRAEGETRITVDIDLDQSMQQQGPNGWRMTPVVGATSVEYVADEESGADVAEEGEIVTA